MMDTFLDVKENIATKKTDIVSFFLTHHSFLLFHAHWFDRSHTHFILRVFPQKKKPGCDFIWICGHKMSYLTPLASLCDIYFWESKENNATEETNIEFYSFDDTIIFLSFWYFDLMCHISILYWKFYCEKCKNNYHFIWNGGLKMSFLTPLVLWCILLN